MSYNYHNHLLSLLRKLPYTVEKRTGKHSVCFNFPTKLDGHTSFPVKPEKEYLYQDYIDRYYTGIK
jgi:hypothetical protein